MGFNSGFKGLKETVHNKTDSREVHMTTTQIGKLTKLIPYPSNLSNYHNYNIIVSYNILIV